MGLNSGSSAAVHKVNCFFKKLMYIVS